MKKRLLVAITITYTGIAGTFIACRKEKATTEQTAPTQSSTQGSQASMSLKFKAGHPASQCHGQGLCFNATPNYFANWIHIPCQGYGKDCDWEIGLSTSFLKSIDDGYGHKITASMPGYSGAEFGMPDRSLFIEPLNKYLNIPKQIAPRNESGEYSYQDVTLTPDPAFSND